MKAEVDKLWAVLKRGDMTGIDRGYSILKDQLDEYLKDLEANKERGLGDIRPIRSQDPSLAAGAHELAREAKTPFGLASRR